MVAPPSLDRLTVEQAVSRYARSLTIAVAGGALSPITRDNYIRDLTEFVRIIEETIGEDVLLDDVTSEQVDVVLLQYGSEPDRRYKDNRVHKTRGPGALARFRQSVSRLFAVAEAEAWIQLSPMSRTKVNPKNQGFINPARKALSELAAKDIIHSPEAATGRAASLSVRDEFILRVLLETGPRVSELCRADRGDIEIRDDGNAWLHIRFGKGGKERWLPLSPATHATYERYVESERPPARPAANDPTGRSITDAETALLLSWRGRRLGPRDVQRMLENAVRQMPAETRRAVTPHGLRHTAATLLLSSGAADIRTVQSLLGHASIATTGLYLDETSHEMAQAVLAHPVTGAKPQRKS